MNSVPNEILSTILSFVFNEFKYKFKPNKITNYELVCKKWRNIINSFNFNQIIFAKPLNISKKPWDLLLRFYSKFSLENINFSNNCYMMTQRIIPHYQAEELKNTLTISKDSIGLEQLLNIAIEYCNKNEIFSLPVPLWSIYRKINWKYKTKPNEWNYVVKLGLDYSSVFPIFSVFSIQHSVQHSVSRSVPIGTERTEKNEITEITEKNERIAVNPELRYLMLLDSWIELLDFPYYYLSYPSGYGWFNIEWISLKDDDNHSYAYHWELITESIVKLSLSKSMKPYIYNFICKYYPLIDWSNDGVFRCIDQKFLEDHLELCELWTVYNWDKVRFVDLDENFFENILIKHFYIAKKIPISLRFFFEKYKYDYDRISKIFDSATLAKINSCIIRRF
jgi:hypothetical protein